MTKYYSGMDSRPKKMKAAFDEANNLPDKVIKNILSANLTDEQFAIIPTRLNKDILAVLAEYDISFYDLVEDTVVYCRDRSTNKDVALFFTIGDDTVLGIMLETKQALRAELIQAIYDNDYNDIQKRGSVNANGQLWLRGIHVGSAKRTSDGKIISVKTRVQIYSPSPAKQLIDRVYDIMKTIRIYPCIISKAA